MPADLAVAGAYAYLDEAMPARALLESAGISCFLENEYTPKAHNKFTQGGGLRLMVAPADLALATEILNSRVSDEELDAEAGGTVPPASEL